MNVAALQKWLARPRTALVAAVSQGVRDHVAALKSQGIHPYGYALLPGEPYDIHSVVAVTNTEADIKVPHTDSQYRYYRFCVDEWTRWEHDRFVSANALLDEGNTEFAAMHRKEGPGVDEFEIAHSNALLDAVLRGLEVAKMENVFAGAEPFLAVWISDSHHPIIAESVRRLNRAAIAEEFMAEFG